MAVLLFFPFSLFLYIAPRRDLWESLEGLKNESIFSISLSLSLSLVLSLNCWRPFVINNGDGISGWWRHWEVLSCLVICNCVAREMASEDDSLIFTLDAFLYLLLLFSLSLLCLALPGSLLLCSGRSASPSSSSSSLLPSLHVGWIFFFGRQNPSATTSTEVSHTILYDISTTYTPIERDRHSPNIFI